MDQDGKKDIVFSNNLDTKVTVLLGNGDGIFRNSVSIVAGAVQGTASIAIADFNGDRKLDLAVNTGDSKLAEFRPG